MGSSSRDLGSGHSAIHEAFTTQNHNKAYQTPSNDVYNHQAHVY